METETEKWMADPAEEHILVCLSASPSNARIIQTAEKMAAAFGGIFTALYVRTPRDDRMTETDRKRLEYHMQLARQAGADIATVYGEDISYQIAEFARISKVTKIVIGRSGAFRRHFWSNATLTEKLTMIVPNIDIHIIPDFSAENKYQVRRHLEAYRIWPSVKDILVMLVFLAGATGVGMIFSELHFEDVNIITVYILGVLLSSLFTRSYVCSIINSVAGVSLFNFFFTEPRLTFHAYEAGYPVTFGVMLLASLITGTLASRLNSQARLSAQAAFRTKILFDTNQLLQKAGDDMQIMHITASQLMKLLDREIIVYPEQQGRLGNPLFFRTDSADTQEEMVSEQEARTALWVFENKKRAGAGTEVSGNARCLYYAVRTNEKVYGVMGIHMEVGSLDSFENSILLSMLGECALAMENIRNAKEKEAEAIRAQNEQIRADLLRAISHDLRTPLTAISGNADYLLSDYANLDETTRKQIFTDIYDDAQWLISLVENLLSITRIEEGRVKLNCTGELVEEVMEEALKHTNRKRGEHNISIRMKDELLLARMDAKLIVQVIINLVDNAVKYTPPGSSIVISAERRGSQAVISVADDGPGIPEKLREKVFEMFFSGENKIADSRRSLGLGLALCRSIVQLHGGEIFVEENDPKGAVFTFTLPLDEVNLYE